MGQSIFPMAILFKAFPYLVYFLEYSLQVGLARESKLDCWTLQKLQQLSAHLVDLFKEGKKND